MLALYRCGRQGEALAAYQRARQVLTAELGVEPGPELRRLQERILAAEPGLIPASPLPDPDPGAAPVAPPSAIVPRQLPAAASHYVGRAS
jgi:hypothetical protein